MAKRRTTKWNGMTVVLPKGRKSSKLTDKDRRRLAASVSVQRAKKRSASSKKKCRIVFFNSTNVHARCEGRPSLSTQGKKRLATMRKKRKVCRNKRTGVFRKCR